MRGYSIDTQAQERVFWEHVLGQGWEARCIAVTINIGRRMSVHISRDDAQDIFQNALLRLLKRRNEGNRSLAELQSDPEAARRYLHGILKNLVLEQARSHGRYTQRFVSDAGLTEQPGAAAANDAGTQQQLQRMIDRLSERQLEILRLKVAGYTQREIADRLEISEPTVSREFGAIRDLYDELESNDE